MEREKIKLDFRYECRLVRRRILGMITHIAPKI